MAKQPKPLLTIAQIEEAAAAVARLQTVHRREERLRAFIGDASNVVASLDVKGAEQPLVFTLSAGWLLDMLADDADQEEQTLRRLGVEVPQPVQLVFPAPIAQPADQEAHHADEPAL